MFDTLATRLVTTQPGIVGVITKSVYLGVKSKNNMATNPLNYKLPAAIGGGDITCLSKSANAQLVIVIFDTNNAIAFTGSGVGTILTAHGGTTHVPVPHSSVPIPITVIFFSHSHSYKGPMELTAIKEPVVTNRPWGNIVNITSQNSSAEDECIMNINLNG